MATQQEEKVLCCRTLSRLYRHSLVDEYIRDEEIYWTADAQGLLEQVAIGYFGSHSSLSILVDGEWKQFKGDEARTFRYVGRKGREELN